MADLNKKSVNEEVKREISSWDKDYVLWGKHCPIVTKQRKEHHQIGRMTETEEENNEVQDLNNLQKISEEKRTKENSISPQDNISMILIERNESAAEKAESDFKDKSFIRKEAKKTDHKSERIKEEKKYLVIQEKAGEKYHQNVTPAVIENTSEDDPGDKKNTKNDSNVQKASNGKKDYGIKRLFSITSSSLSCW